ncbi:MAG: NAD(P)H-dependent oxidoreductase [Deltaproteobacteria bacterium]|nr:NAD(P)H-dependent oxidoreductase [Deltaproteobacteria bacterium]
MFVLGFQGSPRRGGNTNFLLSKFMEAAGQSGAKTHSIFVDKKNIVPCKEYTVCEKKGFCPIDDDMTHEIYPLIRKADIIVVATPIFFYSTTAQMKALIDRCQLFWARKYRLKLTDPGQGTRQGFLLAIGATKGKNLFEGLKLTMTYFFDAVSAKYAGSLTYPGIEKPGDMKNHPAVSEDVRRAAEKLLKPFLKRKRILFACKDNACLSQMASAFMQHLGGDRFEILSGGLHAADSIYPAMEDVMQEIGLDMAFRKPQSIHSAVDGKPLDWLITMGDKTNIKSAKGVFTLHWDFPDHRGKQIGFIRKLRDDIKNRVAELIVQLKQ